MGLSILTNLQTIRFSFQQAHEGYSVFFPDFPGAISAGDDYEDAVLNATECLSLHLYGMMKDDEQIPEPTHMSDVVKTLESGSYPPLFIQTCSL